MIGTKAKSILVIGTILGAAAAAFATNSAKLLPQELDYSGESIAAQSKQDETEALLDQLEAYEKRILRLEKAPIAKAANSYDNASAVSLEEYQTAKRQLRQQISELESALGQSEELIKTLQKQATSAQTKQSQSRASNAALKKIAGNLKKMQKKYDAAVQELHSAKREERQRLLVLEAQERELEQLRSKFEIANRSISESKSTSAKLKNELKSANVIKTERDKLALAIEKRDALIDELEKELKDKKALEAANSNLTTKVENLEKQLSSSAHESNKLLGTIAKLERQVKLAETDLELAAERNKNLASAREQLEERLSNLQATIEEKDSRLSDLNKTLNSTKDKLSSIDKSTESLKQELKQKELEAQSLNSDLASLRDKLQSAQQSNEQLASSLEKTQNDLLAKDEEYNNTTRQLSRAIQEAKALEAKLGEKDLKLAEAASLEQELVATKSALLLKQAEVSRLASGTAPGAEPSTTRGRLSQPTQVSMVAPNADVVIAEVVSKKANLRAGPGTKHSPLMQVGRGTRLTVESTEGDWLRVLTPTGSRAYVRQDVVQIISKPAARPRTQLRRNAPIANSYDSRQSAPPVARTFEDDERRAFESIKSAIGGRR